MRASQYHSPREGVRNSTGEIMSSESFSSFCFRQGKPSERKEEIEGRGRVQNRNTSMDVCYLQALPVRLPKSDPHTSLGYCPTLGGK